ncbi:DUF2189 domain-containing protein [Roseinatronobacter alkalisoli]|uniref:DUF2189 domain-containing protein n=1 Tax=Roseinatronobacter alkalisoli TaxID=3028235 RepID=A0ABT5T7P6_9RHOB|nr:DUF2189 domain-containing protein [Roseinatronobacter sp. HJB301]MDD7971141.1 DUF2189 domain-containing protein [Roseinatronobacter sp. HJB301]
MSDNSSQGTHLPPSVIPEPGGITLADLGAALRAGWSDFRRAPLFGLAFSLVYVLGGLVLYAVFLASGQSWWFIPIAVGFPLLAPFAATGLYEVSRRLEQGEPLSWGAVAGCVFAQRDRQVPSMAMVIMLAFMFWVFVAHTIFALFFGLRPITSSTFDMLMTGSGVMMLLVGGVIGGSMAALLFALSVISLPLLLDKEVDFITAMITSFSAVMKNLFVMGVWAAVIAAMLFVAMLPFFLGLFVVLPVLGHASWHLYRQILR